MLEKGTLPDCSLTSLGKELWNFLGIVGMDWWPWLIKSEGTQPHDWSQWRSQHLLMYLLFPKNVATVLLSFGYCAFTAQMTVSADIWLHLPWLFPLLDNSNTGSLMNGHALTVFITIRVPTTYHTVWHLLLSPFFLSYLTPRHTLTQLLSLCEKVSLIRQFPPPNQALPLLSHGTHTSGPQCLLSVTWMAYQWPRAWKQKSENLSQHSVT